MLVRRATILYWTSLLLTAFVSASAGSVRSLKQGGIFNAALATLGDGKGTIADVTALSGEYGKHKFPFIPSQTGYTVLVDTDPDAGVTAVEFYFDGGEWTEYVAPYSMAGGEGEQLYPSPYLSSECGPKVILVMGKSGSTILFEEELSFELTCPTGDLDDTADRCGGNTFRCPEYTFAVTECPMTVEDCDCSTGYVKAGYDACVPMGVVDDPGVDCFECPRGTETTAYCPMSLKDCAVEQNYDGDYGNAQVVANPRSGCTFKCPDGLIPYGTVCPEDIYDCDCDIENMVKCPAGTEPLVDCPVSIEEHCDMATKVPTECFSCPDNSDPIDDCPLSIDDCEPYNDFSALCIFVCPVGMEPDQAYDDCPTNVDDCVCVSDFLCPKNTEPLAMCPASLADCVVIDDDGLDMTAAKPLTAECFECPTGTMDMMECPHNIDDCDCATEFECPVGTDKLTICPSNLADCMAIRDPLDAKTAATVKQCTTNFRCPSNSEPLVECPLCPDDCVMGRDPMDTVDAVTTATVCFQCPTGTVGLNDCPATMRDCMCSNTFECPLRMEPYDSICPQAESDCICSVTCPEGLVFADASPSAKCPSSDADCTCSSATTFQCPPGWTATTECPMSIDDCDDECVRTGYMCPAHAFPASSCVMSITDCECKPGFIKAGEECVEVGDVNHGVEDGDTSSELDGGSCSFVCPNNSQATTNDCPQSEDDCECIANYFWNKGGCDSCIVPGCKWMETYDFESQQCIPNTYPTTYPPIFNCPHRSYTVQYRNTGTLLDCECNCNKPKNICTGWCIESCTGKPLYPGQ